MKIIKRDGREAPFDRGKICRAIDAANADMPEADRLPGATVSPIAADIERQCESLGRAVHVEEVQDMIEDALLSNGYPRLMRHFSDYRFKRELVRKANTTDGRILALIERNNEEAKQENANKNPVINSTQRDYIAGEVSRDLTRRLLLPMTWWPPMTKVSSTSTTRTTSASTCTTAT